MLTKHFLILILLCIAVIFVFPECGKQKSDESGKEKVLKIAVIPKGTSHEFWKTIHAGAKQAAEETGVEIIWKGPIREDDREEQIQIVETFIGSGIDAIVLAPLDDRSLVLPVREASELGIPTIVIDSDLQESYHISFVATDNYRGGVMAAHRVGELLNGKGNVIIIRYQEGSASNTNREEGFRETMIKEYPSVEILSDNQYVGPTTESSYRGCENLLNRYPEANAMFAPNEPVAFGCLRALTERDLAGKVFLVGFDASDKLIEGLRNGYIHGLVLQDPFSIGYLGVKTAVKSLAGEKVEPRIDTGIVLVTQNNIENPAIKKLWKRDISE
ncbi:MAG: substrate-binding domain-containing protein [Candidatus Latescibacteria bacterium]|nr:substrate-binding domain-containing protein [Candidatus Latescibacterota bacterium]